MSVEVKYQLEAAAVGSADVSGAKARTYVVVVSFGNGGQEKWTDLTPVACGNGSAQIAFLLDGSSWRRRRSRR